MHLCAAFKSRVLNPYTQRQIHRASAVSPFANSVVSKHVFLGKCRNREDYESEPLVVALEVPPTKCGVRAGTFVTGGWLTPNVRGIRVFVMSYGWRRQ